jgi:hypothetical protein
MQIATPRLKSSWRSLDAHGESQGRECVGSVNNVMLLSSTGHIDVPDVAMGGVTSVLDHRKYSYMLYNRIPPLTNCRIKKAKKEESFDPQLVAAVEAKLRALDVESDALTSGL